MKLEVGDFLINKTYGGVRVDIGVVSEHYEKEDLWYLNVIYSEGTNACKGSYTLELIEAFELENDGWTKLDV
jgi:hypothetical protein